MIRHLITALLLIPLIFTLTQCELHRAAWEKARTDVDAENKIMPVQHHPLCLGQKRLNYAAQSHPSFATFLNQIGTPDFIAETTQGQRHYMILYLLEKRHAYSCCTLPHLPQAPMQVAGPYPISPNEYQRLRVIKHPQKITTSQS